MIFKKQAEKDFRVKDTTSARMMAKVVECANIYRGAPYWLDAENRIKTINFAKAVCSETARLVTLGIKIQIDGGARGAWLQEQKQIFAIEREEELTEEEQEDVDAFMTWVKAGG